MEKLPEIKKEQKPETKQMTPEEVAEFFSDENTEALLALVRYELAQGKKEVTDDNETLTISIRTKKDGELIFFEDKRKMRDLLQKGKTFLKTK